MFGDVLSRRWLQVGLAFFVLLVVGSLLYSCHPQRTTEKAMEQHNRSLQEHAEQNETRPAAVDVPTETETPVRVNTLDENPDTPTSEATEELPNEIEDTSLPEDSTAEEDIAEDVPVSPFGFGPYPEIPADFPHLQSWDQIVDESDPDWELMARVMIKLWKQGTEVIAADMTNGLVYPTLKDTLYIEWGETSGPDGPVRYILQVSGDPAAAMRLESITENLGEHESLSEADLPSDITFIPYSEGGIDPYTFLDLPKNRR